MPYRVYYLARQLGIDSPKLLSICNQLGIAVKNSALDSLEDNEAARIAEFLDKKLGAPEVRVAGAGPTPRTLTTVVVEIPSTVVESLISGGKIRAANQLPGYIKSLLEKELDGRHSRLEWTADELAEKWVKKNVNLNRRHPVDDIAEYANQCEKYLQSYGFTEHHAKCVTSRVFINNDLRRRPRRHW